MVPSITIANTMLLCFGEKEAGLLDAGGWLIKLPSSWGDSKIVIFLDYKNEFYKLAGNRKVKTFLKAAFNPNLHGLIAESNRANQGADGRKEVETGYNRWSQQS